MSESNILNLIDINRAKATLCRMSFYDFVKEFWDEAAKGSMFVPTWFTKEIADELEEVGFNLAKRRPKKKDLLINLFPGAGKTTLITILWPSWLIVIDPSLYVICVSYSDKKALIDATKGRDVVDSEKFKKLFPGTKIKADQASKSNFMTTEGGGRYSTSVKGTLTGIHGDAIVCDDLVNVQQANSEIERELANKFVSETLSSRKKNKLNTVTVFVNQRLAINDITGYLLARKGEDKYKHICIPAELNGTLRPTYFSSNYKNGLADPILASKEALDDQRDELGTRAYNSQYLQDPESDEDSILKAKWFKIITQEEFNEALGDKTPVYNFYLDTAYSDKSTADYSVILACTKIDEILYITGVSRVKKEFNQLVRHIKTYTANQGYNNRSMIMIEPRASGVSIADYLKEQTDLNVVKGEVPRDSKDTRLTAVSPKVEFGKVILIAGDWNNVFLSEVTAVSPTHDDQRDVLSNAIQENLIKNRNNGKPSYRFVR